MDTYSVPQESQKLLLEGLINNRLHASAPSEIKEAAKHVEYVGSKAPSVPINWRFAESVSAIKGFQGSMLNVLLKKKYGVEYQKIVIDTDHAQLFFMSPYLPVIDPLGAHIPSLLGGPAFNKYFPDGDKYKAFDGTTFRTAATNIYRTKDGRYYHLHASLNPVIIHEVLNIDPGTEVTTVKEACKVYEDKVSQYTAKEIETMMNDKHRQAGSICWSTEEYKASAHGKVNAHVGLFEVHHIPNPTQRPTWWTPVEGHTGPSRPLYGLKVLDLTRIIASSTVTRELAELGASVLRITSPNVTDLTSILPDLSWGKWSAHLDLTKVDDRARLRALVEESDVVVDGYRPGVMAKWGFGKEDILGLFEKKERGVIYVHENCYGWNGPWAYRSGWQQVSDANCGVSMEFGKAMGHGEPVTPVFPNADFCTGAAGAIGVLQALIERSEKGGSFVLDVALNYYSQWLINTCSTYPPEVWDALWTTYGRPVFHHADHMGVTFPRFYKMLTERGVPVFNPDFFEVRGNKAIGVPIKTVKPILGFPQGVVQVRYNVGSRGNGVDYPRWPEDLLTETLTV
ncbi:hypothetical protein GALMADRAFT_156064 [Galerina marginata CBS 339.88]|uniref:Uncharacterized protein n=1 Tax=Galerina marginata (strain CBS 339.88) TaxID=685588 RepID=A0A067T035_GALM3|nr:hypothetical protein GALMADRAFT_156064 [Galerina marginata CBS 339.88]